MPKQIDMETKSNKTIVAEFYKYIIGQRNEALIDTYVREDYIQHSPSGKDGREGLREMIGYLKTLPLPVEKTSPIKLILADGDFVAGLMHISLMGKRMFVVDLFRIKDGQLAEHWDAVQDTVDNDFNEIVIDPAADAGINKELVRTRYESLDKYQAHKVIGEGDIVIAQLEFAVDDQRFVRYDILRVSDKIIDQILSVQQQIPDVMTHNNGMI